MKRLNLKLRGAVAHVPVDQLDGDRKYISRLLASYASSIDAGIRSFSGGSDMEKGYLLEKISALRDAVNYYL